MADIQIGGFCLQKEVRLRLRRGRGHGVERRVPRRMDGVTSTLLDCLSDLFTSLPLLHFLLRSAVYNGEQAEAKSESQRLGSRVGAHFYQVLSNFMGMALLS